MNQNNGLLFRCLLLLGVTVAIGAFGAHMIKPKITERYMDIYETAVQYQFIHTLGMVAFAMYFNSQNKKVSKSIILFFLAGIICFCGSLYMISLHELFDTPALRKFGAVAPIGGLSFIVFWILSALEIKKV